MLIDVHCHIDAYPEPALALAAGEAAGLRTVAVSTSLISYVRTRILCRHSPHTWVALGLHPRRAGKGYDQWPEWRETLETAPIIGEVGLDFRGGKEENWAAQARTLGEIAQTCGAHRLLNLHSHYAEVEVWDVVNASQARWVVWHDYRPDAPRLPLYRAVEAGHFVAIGPDALRGGAVSSRLRAIPREQVLTETNAPWSCLATGDRAASLRETLAVLAQAWRCAPQEAEAQVESNFLRATADLAMRMDASVGPADRGV